MADRGLYGQTESDAGVINAAKESRGNIEAEGLRTSDGNVTEEGYRIAMSKAARRDFEARRGEDNAQRSAMPDFIRGIAVRGWQDDQRGALQIQADLAATMRAEGFALGNVYAALTVAPGKAGAEAAGEREARSRAFQGAPDRVGFEIKKAVRRKPRMYGLHVALVNTDGTPINNGRGEPIKV